MNKKYMQKSLILMLSLAFLAPVSMAQQLPNSTFEDWSGEKFDGKEQPKSWNFSNVTQVGMSFNFAHKEAGHNGGNCVMAQDQEVGAFGITEVSPSYISLGTPWVYLPSITQINKATAGTYGGINWTYRPDSMSVWIKRTGANVLREDFHLLFYAWKGTAKGNSYKGKNGDCTSVSWTNEESDIRLATDGNECGTAQKATQICEGWYYEKKEYAQWTNIRVPIYYMNDEVPTMANIIFSASNYPNFRANGGLYAGNSLYVDDVEMIYSARIDQLFVGDKPWNGFNPDTEEEQTYSVGNATTVPTIYAKRGIGSLTNSKGKTTNFIGRRLTESECKITYGKVGEVTTIKVTSADGKKTRTYKIRFAKELSKNADLAEVKVNGEPIVNFSGSKLNYDVALPYGTKTAPVITCQTADEVTSCTITQATSATGTAKVVVVAANSAYSKTYTFKFSIAPLADNELKGIEVNGTPIPDFLPTITSYRISLPLDTKTCPTVKAISAYPDGAQTIKHTQPASGWIEAMKGQYVLAVTTPGNPIAKKYTLNFSIKASENCQLADLQVIVGGQNELLFHSNNKQYYITLPMGTKELPEIKYTPGDAYQTITIEKNGVNGVTKILVTAANGDQSIYKIGFETETSSESRLKSIALDGVPLAGFNPDVKVYEVSLPIGTTTLPKITCDGMDEYVETTIQTGGVNGTTRITGTAGDGSYTLYQIVFSVQQATIATLDSIYVNGLPLEGFSKDVFEYTMKLPSSTTEQPIFTWKAHDKWQDISLRKPSDIAGDYKIIVKPQSGASNMYLIHVEVVLSSNTSLKNIVLEGCDDFVFNPSIHEYTYTVQAGSMPKVSFEKAEDCQKVVSVTTDNKVSLRLVAEDGSVSTYTIMFEVPKSENAYLKMIYVDGDSLKDFLPEDLTYSYELKGTTCPTIKVDKADDKQQVTITKPQKEGLARIIVQPETGNANIYTIDMKTPISEDVYLKNILVNGVGIADWKESQLEYTVSYKDSMPAITAIANEGQKIDTVRTANQISFIVSKNDRKCMYIIHLQQILSNASQLKAIKADGVLLEGWNADKLNYTYTLEAGATIPALTYEKKEESQQVIFGQDSLHRFVFRVMAQDGTTSTYMVAYNVARYTNTELKSIKLDGIEVLKFFKDNQLIRYITEGKELPSLTYTKAVGQSVIALNTSATQQQIMVLAENGDSRVYTIDYEVQTDANALLSDIKMYVEGSWISLPRFRKDSSEYAYELAWTDIRQRATNAPCIWPISNSTNQSISITYAPLNEKTTIHVETPDGQTKDYTILFSVRKSSNTKLGMLSINNEDQDVEKTDFEWNIGVGEDLPPIEYQPAEDVQHIEYVSANRYETTKIIVTAESGDQRTYSIHYNIPEPEGENIIKSILYSYTSATGETIEDSIVAPTLGDNIVDLPFGAKEFIILDVKKNYKEQTVMLLNAGIRRGATIIVASNQKNVDDAEYHVIVRMPEFLAEGKLKELKFKGQLIPNFRPDVYNYIVGVTAQPTVNDFTYTTYNGKSVTPSSLDTKKKQITFKVADGETYSVCWYYTNENPFDFTKEWITNNQGTGYKPSSAWTVPGDVAKDFSWGISAIKFYYTTGMEIISSGSNGVLLSTIHGAPLSGSVPGMMTLGGMALKLADTGNSTSSISETTANGFTFHNTPELLEADYKELMVNKVTSWSIRLKTCDGTNISQASSFTGNYSNLNQQKHLSIPVDYSGLSNPISKIHFTANACHTENAKELNKGAGGNIYTSELLLNDIHFVYNSTLTSATIDGQATDFSDNTFMLNVPANYLQTPALRFTGAVHDQMQTIEWLNNGEWLNGDLKAKVTNYGENMKDNTIYYVVLHREAQTSLDMTVNIPASANAQIKAVEGKQYENLIILPNGTKHLPDMTIMPNNIHQQIVVRKSGQVVTIVVTNENAETRTYKYTFVEAASDNVDLQQIKGVEGFAAAAREYRVATIPEVTEFVKVSEGQTVRANHMGDSILIEVTAEDGVHHGFYRIYKDESAKTTSAQLDELKVANKDVQGFRDNIYRYTMATAELVSFVRKDAADRVLQTISADSIMIRLTGTETHAYVIEFPQEVSQNAYLKDIRVNDATIDNFDPTSELPYTIVSDTAIDVQFIVSECDQVVELTCQPQAEGYDIQAVVTAADQTTKFTYRVCVRPDKSNDATLRMIYVEGVEVPYFTPEQTTYQVVLPTVSPKQSEPNMPSLTYEVGQVGQRVAIEAAKRLGETTYLTVIAEDGTENTYEIEISAEPSHCAELTNIFVNDDPIADFKASRTWYSCRVLSDEVNIAYSTDDRFQRIEIKPLKAETENLSKVIVVTAQDGTKREYELDIFRETSSNNANLANILLDGVDFTTYAQLHNITISPFAAKRYEYDIDYVINRPLPDIDVQLQEDGQMVATRYENDTYIISVTAPDGESKNDYRLHFRFDKSANVALKMIYLNGEALQGFSPLVTEYAVVLPIGTKSLPNVLAEPAEGCQQVAEPMTKDMKTTIEVTAENGSKQNYIITFSFTLSDADHLKAIMADGQNIHRFAADSFYYYYLMPVGQRPFPLIEWEAMDKYQTITSNTMEQGLQSTTQITVTAENGSRNVYTVVHEIQRSQVDTLQMIYLNGVTPLADFEATRTDYQVVLPEGTTTVPTLDFSKGDEWQTVVVETATSVNGISKIIVYAECGISRTYIIDFSVAPSINAFLSAIMVDGEAITSFDAEIFDYTVELPYGTTKMPAISAQKADNQQNISLAYVGWDAVLTVQAADTTVVNTYTIHCVVARSSNSKLADLQVEGYELEFDANVNDYEILLPNGTTDLPAVTPVLGDEQQVATVTMDSVLQYAEINVVSGDENSTNTYHIRFIVEKCHINHLLDIQVKGATIEGFHQDTLEYTFIYPCDAPKDTLITDKDITYTLADSTETVEVSYADAVITILVTAEDGSIRVYKISQTFLLPSNSTLSAIMVDGVLLKGFEPTTYFYTYLLPSGAVVPAVTAIAQDSTAEIDVILSEVGDTTFVYCTAADGTISTYALLFAHAPYNDGVTAKANDVFFKHVVGTHQYVAATIRKNVQVAIYDQSGQLLYFSDVPTADPNAVRVVVGLDGMEQLTDVTDASQGALIDVKPGEPYVYVFYESGTHAIASGKFMLSR